MGEFISTDEVSEQERLNYWNDLVSRTFVRLEVTPLTEAPFYGAISTDQLAFVKLSKVTVQPSLVARLKQFLAQTSEEYVQVIYQLVGEMTFTQEGRTAHLGPGDWVFLDCRPP